jgi:beta-glucosidase
MTADLAHPLAASAPAAKGGNPNLFHIIVQVKCSVMNTGSIAGAEVAKLYISIPNSPPKQLRGFGKKTLVHGQTKNFNFSLTEGVLSIWSME